jgi:tRNA(fMet)-specific endonuclease VapC
MVTLEHPLRQKILDSMTEGNAFSVCVPVVTEMFFGISVLPRAKRNQQEWQLLKVMFPCLVPDPEDAEGAAELQVMLRKRGWQLDTIDALIATVALRYDLTLLTTDRDFAAVPSLEIENWLQN